MKTRLFVLLLCLCLFFYARRLCAQNNQSVTIITEALEFVFQPPSRISASSEHQLCIEIPKVNMAVNLIENYIQYLIFLKKIDEKTHLKFIYAPDSKSSDAENAEIGDNAIMLSDLGLNGILSKVNANLRKNGSTDDTHLLNSADALFSISDKYQRRKSKIVDLINLKNLSKSPKSLEPDSEFALIGSDSAVVTRPYLRNNRIFKIAKNSGEQYEAKMLLGPAKKWYENLTPSYDGKYLAFTDGLTPMLLASGSAEPIFGNKKVALLKMAWSPVKPYLAGMVLDVNSQERVFFVYNAEKQEMIDCGDRQIKEQSDYFNAFPYWSPDGKKIIMTSVSSINLIYPEEKRCAMNVIKLPGEISELIWANDSSSFALVETVGQARNQYKFDDLDFRHSILHRFQIGKRDVVVEDQGQRTVSRNTIKLVTFYNNGQILYLEGRLVSKRFPTPIWELQHDFSAYLTPHKSKNLSRPATPEDASIARTKLPVRFLIVYKNLDSKYKNVYDTGFRHTNYANVKEFNNLWIIGLKRPPGVSLRSITFNNRRFPYPFVEKNTCIFSSAPYKKIKKFTKFLEEYELRSFAFNYDATKLYVLANFEGPLNLFCANKSDIFEKLSLNDN